MTLKVILRMLRGCWSSHVEFIGVGRVIFARHISGSKASSPMTSKPVVRAEQGRNSGTGMMLRLDLTLSQSAEGSVEVPENFELVCAKIDEIQSVSASWLQKFSAAWMAKHLVPSWSILLLRDSVVVAACLVGRMPVEPTILTFGVAPEFRRQGLGRALLWRVIGLVRAGGESDLWVGLGKNQVNARNLVESLGFTSAIGNPTTVEEAITMAEMARQFDGSDEAALRYQKAASKLRELGDQRAEGIAFRAALHSAPTLLYWLDLAHEFARPGGGEEFHLDSPSPEGVRQLESMCERIFFDRPSFLRNFLRGGFLPASTVALRDGEPIGACLISTEERCATVNALMVAQNDRRRGLGSLMLSRSLAKLRDARCKTVLAHVLESNETSRATFASLGFRQIETLEQLLEFGSRGRAISYQDLIHVVGRDMAKEAMALCWSRKIAIVNPPQMGL